MTRSPAGDRERERDGAFWVDGDMLFQVEGFGVRPGRLVKVRRPFALIGRSNPCDILLDDRAVNAQHLYLHMDERGVFVVDLATRSGSRINGEDRVVGWLRPGDAIEVADFRVELVRARVSNIHLRQRDEAPPAADEMLGESPRADLPSVTLDPRIPGERPWVLGSELVFLGASAACGIRVRDQAVARAHCAIVRAASGAFLVDLADGPTWVEDQSTRPAGALPLHDGDMITLGNTRFSVRIDPPPLAKPAASDMLPAPYHRVFDPADRAPIDPEILPAETQNALMAWMMGTIQGSQGEALRRQGEFQLAMTEALRIIQQDNATLLNAHLSRLEKIDRALVALRTEIERRGGGVAPAPATRMAPVPPDVLPLNIPRNIPLPSPEPDPPGVQASTAWILQRVGQLEAESRSTWKDLLGRVSTPPKSRSDGWTRPSHPPKIAPPAKKFRAKNAPNPSRQPSTTDQPDILGPTTVPINRTYFPPRRPTIPRASYRLTGHTSAAFRHRSQTPLFYRLTGHTSASRRPARRGVRTDSPDILPPRVRSACRRSLTLAPVTPCDRSRGPFPPPRLPIARTYFGPRSATVSSVHRDEPDILRDF